MAWWDGEIKNKAIELAIATTAENAAKKTGIPAGTIRRWISNLKNERSKIEHSAAGYCAAIAHKSGKRCRLKALPGSEYCRRHADQIENQCTAYSRQTKQRCKNKALPGKTKCKFHGGAATGPPKGSHNHLKHGFFSRIFPDDEDTRALVDEIINKNPLDILWENIMIQYLAIARAQRIMFVKDKEDLTKHLKRERSSINGDEYEWEFQYPWDKHANFLSAQSKATTALEKLISSYEDLLQRGHISNEHKLRLEKLKQDIDIAKERLELEKAKMGRNDEPGKGDTWADLAAGDDDDATEES